MDKSYPFITDRSFVLEERGRFHEPRDHYELSIDLSPNFSPITVNKKPITKNSGQMLPLINRVQVQTTATTTFTKAKYPSFET